MRFPSFNDNWKKYRVSDVLETYSTNSLTWNDLSNDPTSLKNIHYGLIHRGFTKTGVSDDNSLIPFIIEKKIPKNYTQIKEGDLILTDASEDKRDVGKPIEIIKCTDNNLISGLHTIHARDKLNITEIGYKGFYFKSKSMKHQLYRLTVGSKIFGISPNNFNEMFISIPNKKEQKKIIQLLTQIENRIETQIKIIDSLTSQINWIKKYILNNIKVENIASLGQLCNITTGKKDANEMKKDGAYKFFTCSKEEHYIDTYSFEGESLIVSGNGELGLIKYYNGKFDAYQRTYVLQDFTCNTKFLKYILEIELPKKIAREKNVGAMPYIILKTLSSLIINLPSDKVQNKVVNIIEKIELKLNNEKKILSNYKKEKNYLLTNLFM